MKSQGNQITKLKVKEIVLDHDIEGDEPWPNQKKEESADSNDENDEQDANSDAEEGTEDEAPQKMEWDVSKDDEDPNQEKLF